MALSISNTTTNKPPASGMFGLNRLTPGFGMRTTTPSMVTQPPVVQTPPAQTSQGPVVGLQTPPVNTGSSTGSGTGYVATPSQTSSTTPTATATATPTRGLFGSIASSLANPAPNTTAQNYTQQAVDYGAGSIPIADRAKTIADEYGKRYADLGIKGANFEAGQLTTGTSPVAEGNAAVTAQTTAAQQAALAAGESAALQGIGYQLTGQEQAANAANAGAGQAYTGQTITQAGQLGAAGLVKPSPTSYGQTVFDPTTGTFTGGGGNLDPQTQATSFAQKVINGQMTYEQALSSLGYAGNVGSTFLNNAITAAGGNPLQLQASGGATQDVIGTQTQQVEGYKSALQQGQNLQSQLTDLITSFGLNPSDINGVNTGLQKIANNVSDPRYKILQNYVNDIANTYSQVLTPPGGSATDTTRSLSASMIDATAKGTSLIQTMKSLDEAAKAKIAGVQTTGVRNSQGSSGSSSQTGTVHTSAGAVNTNW